MTCAKRNFPGWLRATPGFRRALMESKVENRGKPGHMAGLSTEECGREAGQSMGRILNRARTSAKLPRDAGEVTDLLSATAALALRGWLLSWVFKRSNARYLVDFSRNNMIAEYLDRDPVFAD